MNIEYSSQQADGNPIPRILLVDDHDLVREALAVMLKGKMSLILGETNNGIDALKMIKHNVWDMVLLDINLPDTNGLELLKKIKNEYPTVPILMLTMNNDLNIALKAYKYGASGYFCKNESSQKLLTAIQHILKGEQYFNAATLKYFISHSQDSKTLSNRESEFMALLAAGKNQTQIAEELGISVKTVGTYRNRILEKLNLKTSAELLIYALRDQL